MEPSPLGGTSANWIEQLVLVGVTAAEVEVVVGLVAEEVDVGVAAAEVEIVVGVVEVVVDVWVTVTEVTVEVAVGALDGVADGGGGQKPLGPVRPP